MSQVPLPVEAARGDERHRDVSAEVFRVVPQQPATWRKRLFWTLVLRAARYPALLRLFRRGGGS